MSSDQDIEQRLMENEQFMTEPSNARAGEFYLDEPSEEPGLEFPPDYEEEEEEPVEEDLGGYDPDDEAKQQREDQHLEEMYSRRED